VKDFSGEVMVLVWVLQEVYPIALADIRFGSFIRSTIAADQKREQLNERHQGWRDLKHGCRLRSMWYDRLRKKR